MSPCAMAVGVVRYSELRCRMGRPLVPEPVNNSDSTPAARPTWNVVHAYKHKHTCRVTTVLGQLFTGTAVPYLDVGVGVDVGVPRRAGTEAPGAWAGTVDQPRGPPRGVGTAH